MNENSFFGVVFEHAGELWQGVTSREMTFPSVESEQVSNGTCFDKASLIASVMIKQETIRLRSH